VLNINEHINSGLLEELPKKFVVKFEEVLDGAFPQVKVTINENQSGDIVDDNSYDYDGYRYHDVFHYTFATLLGWSPCVRSMLKRKRKSNQDIDRIEDGARATITEECISLMIFSNAKQNNFYKGVSSIESHLLQTIKNMTEPFEIKNKTIAEWETVILKSYEMFRLLNLNKGGVIQFDAQNSSVEYIKN
jgi:hypothetical protein